MTSGSRESALSFYRGAPSALPRGLHRDSCAVRDWIVALNNQGCLNMAHSVRIRRGIWLVRAAQDVFPDEGGLSERTECMEIHDVRSSSASFFLFSPAVRGKTAEDRGHPDDFHKIKLL